MPKKLWTLSHDDIRDLLRVALNEAAGGAGKNVWVRSVYPDSVIYEVERVTPEGVHPSDCTFRRSYDIGQDLKVTLGEEEKVREVRSFETVAPASFSVEDREEVGEWVERTGKIFQLGEYPDKKFSLTDAEADDALSVFSPVENNLEHRKTILDGKLGQLVGVVRQGRDLIGKIRIPKWLDAIHGPEPLKVSAEWTRGASKRLTGLALTMNPRVEDAAVFAAFTAAEEDGEITPPPVDSGASRKGVPAMKKPLLKRLAAMFSSLTEEDLAELESEETPPVETKPADETEKPDDQPDPRDAEIQRLKDELAAKETEKTANDQARLQEAAEKFANDTIHAGKAWPAEKDALVADFTARATSDGADTALFSADGALVEGAGIRGLKALIDARPTMDFTAERLKEGNVAVVFAGGSSGADGQPDPARIRELMAMTPLGQQILQERK